MVGRKLGEFGCQKGVAELAKPSWVRGVLDHSYVQLPDFSGTNARPEIHTML